MSRAPLHTQSEPKGKPNLCLHRSLDQRFPRLDPRRSYFPFCRLTAAPCSWMIARSTFGDNPHQTHSPAACALTATTSCKRGPVLSPLGLGRHRCLLQDSRGRWLRHSATCILPALLHSPSLTQAPSTTLHVVEKCPFDHIPPFCTLPGATACTKALLPQHCTLRHNPELWKRFEIGVAKA